MSENDFGTVTFAVKLEGIKQSFGDFHYYRQCVIDDVTGEAITSYLDELV